MAVSVRQVDEQVIESNIDAITPPSGGFFAIPVVFCGLGLVLFLIASTIVLSLIPLYTSPRTVKAADCKSASFDSTFNINNGGLPNNQLSVNNQVALQNALNQYLTTQSEFGQCSIQVQNANVASCSNNGGRRRRRQVFLKVIRLARQSNTYCKSQQITTKSTLNCNCRCNKRCLQQRRNQLQTLLLSATIPVAFVEPSDSTIILSGPNVPTKTTVDSSSGNNQSDECYKDIGGIYLRRLTDSDSASQVSYALALFTPPHGVIQTDSAEKTNTSNYFSDLMGYYQCEKLSQSNITRVSVTSIYFKQSGKRNVNVVQSMIDCNSVTDDCSDRVIQCSNGQLQSQAYELTLPDQQTGQYPSLISNSQQTRQFEWQRIYVHPPITTNDRDKCYYEMSGVYIDQYPDDVYDITLYTPSGYILSVYPASGNAGDTFLQSTTMGTWYCTDSRSVTGFYNYFTYSNITTSQSINSGTYYMQCTSETYTNCTGISTEIDHPLQYQFLPFRNGQFGTSSASTYTSKRLYIAPTAASCHNKFSGAYTFSITIASLNIIYLNTYTFFPDTTYFSTGLYETDSTRRHSNMLGTWNCDLNGNITANLAFFAYPTVASSSTTAIVVSKVQLKCNDNADQCDGRFFTSQTTKLELPVNGVFPSAQSSVNGTITGRRLKPTT